MNEHELKVLKEQYDELLKKYNELECVFSLKTSHQFLE